MTTSIASGSWTQSRRPSEVVQTIMATVVRMVSRLSEAAAERRLRAFMERFGEGHMTPEIERNVDAVVSGRIGFDNFPPRSSL